MPRWCLVQGVWSGGRVAGVEMSAVVKVTKSDLVVWSFPFLVGCGLLEIGRSAL